MNSGWGKDGSGNPSCSDDRIELIEDTTEARAEFGKNFGAFEFGLSREQVEGLLAGKVVAIDISQREYVGFISLKK